MVGKNERSYIQADSTKTILPKKRYEGKHTTEEEKCKFPPVNGETQATATINSPKSNTSTAAKTLFVKKGERLLDNIARHTSDLADAVTELQVYIFAKQQAIDARRKNVMRLPMKRIPSQMKGATKQKKQRTSRKQAQK